MKKLLWLVPLLVGCTTVSVAPEPELPPIPTQVMSQLGPVPVVIVDSLTNGEGRQMMGGFHTIRRTIYLRRDLLQNPRVAHVVLQHEICHVWSIDSGVAALLSMEAQQAICDASAIYRVSEMLLSRKPR